MASHQEAGGGTSASNAAGNYYITIFNAGTTTGPATRSVHIRELGTQLTVPLKAAQDHILSIILTLLPGLATLLKEMSMKHLSADHRLSLRERNIARMEEDNEEVPVPARVSFKLQVWNEAEESTEFTALTTETNIIVKTFQLNLKE
jgi:hypothetical protein